MNTERSIIDEIDIAILKLEPITTVIQFALESFGLTNIELTEKNKFDLIHRANMLGDVLTLTQTAIYDVTSEIKALCDEAYARTARKDSDESTDTTETTK